MSMLTSFTTTRARGGRLVALTATALAMAAPASAQMADPVADVSTQEERVVEPVIVTAQPFLPVLDPVTEGLYTLERVSARGVQPDGPPAGWTPIADCSDTCPSFTITSATPAADVPLWVQELPIYGEVVADGPITRPTTFYASNVMVIQAYAGPEDCRDRHACLWTKTEFRGERMWQSNTTGTWHQLAVYNFEDKASSARNRGRTHHFCLYDGGGSYGGSYMDDLPARHMTGSFGKVLNNRIDHVMITPDRCA